ncbi:MAG: glutaredoxin family protein [Vibrio sp.]|uniref:Glutaredoxin family protein n=1 Tax=Vibrio chanodichtyis TaxID=3027932 RepID=A0ABT5UYI0_9VIBR|nr:glutaredoxin family protein [Vibrio chanodichtyis]MDE1514156.1 glutaredoxin family protein [Vibrio chanodichtyis]
MITLYSTQGCHLCEMAQELLDKVGLQATQVDIALDEQLFSRYAVTIPVVAYQTSELYWPFDLQELIEWLHNNGINYHP